MISYSRNRQEENSGGFHECVPRAEGITPRREHDRAITMKEGAQISNVRPYRYPYY